MQTDEDVAHKYVIFFWNTNQFIASKFSVPYMKPHGMRVLGNHYHLRFPPKLVHGTYKIHKISCACI